jgi:hypothetical protein
MFSKRIIAAHMWETTRDKSYNLNGKNITLRRLAMDWIIMVAMAAVAAALVILLAGAAHGGSLTDYIIQQGNQQLQQQQENSRAQNIQGEIALQGELARQQAFDQDWHRNLRRQRQESSDFVRDMLILDSMRKRCN